MAARDDSRRDAEYDGAEYSSAEHDGGEHAGAEYDGMDALMAVLTDEPLPEEALADAEFMAARQSAATDVALLREQLGLIAEAAISGTGEEWAEAADPPGRLTAARPGDAAGTETGPGRGPEPEAAPVPPVRPLPTRPARPRRHRRALSLAFGTLAAAAAATVVVGLGWVVVQSAGGANTTASDSGVAQKDSDLGTDSGGNTDESGSLRTEGYIACARLIVEGTVVSLEPVPGTQQDRVTLDVDRYYKPDRGADEIVFPMDEDVDPRLKVGDHVLIGIPRDTAEPDIWTTDEEDIAHDRAWIKEALADAEGLTCE
ncbi:hypothetical protein [Streptomyces capitiformicae]|uniref:Uncharacterized protein n=1 Tax=Streptomyces capitiformicae TaxID=2014920 RepID=A0A919GGP8_9ACTN|nr:hypothetical protein [Streptomyces capitiformicae]GHH84395.1 hypothetical protein GCM10017771_13580 [Streptomyces capitiformicae]